MITKLFCCKIEPELLQRRAYFFFLQVIIRKGVVTEKC